MVRQGHEIQIQQMAQEVRFLQWRQAQEPTEALLRSRAVVLERYRYHQRLLGLSGTTTDVLDVLSADRRELTEANFDEAYAALVEGYAGVVTAAVFPKLVQAPESSVRPPG